MSDHKDLDRPNWTPLETRLCEARLPVSVCGAFMWMWRQDGSNSTSTSNRGGTCCWILNSGVGGKVRQVLSSRISRASFAA